jgi:hypothetical protein
VVGLFFRFISQEIDDEEAFAGLFTTLFLIITFVMFVVASLQHTEVFAIQESIDNDIEENANFAFNGPMGNKIFRDAHNVADFWSWLRLGAVPLIIQPTYGYSEQYPYNETAQVGYFDLSYDSPQPSYGHYLRYNRILGGIRLSQQVAEASECLGPTTSAWEDNDIDNPWLRKPCFDAPGWDLPPDHAWLPLDASERIEWLFPGSTSEENAQHIVDMEDGCSLLHLKQRPCKCQTCASGPWLDDSTVAVELRSVFFNPTYGIFSRLQVYFIFSRGGRIWKRADLQSIPVKALNAWSLVGGGAWLLLNAWIVCTELLQVASIVSQLGVKGFRERYLDFWNAVDWLSIFIAVWICICFAGVRAATSSTSVAGAVSLPAVEDQALLDQMLTDLDAGVAAAANFRIALAWYSVVIILRLFKAFSSQPRLALVSKTLAACTTDVFHFGVVFSSIFFMYSVAGYTIFGHRVAGFASLGASVRTTGFVVMGDVDWEQMEHVGRFYAYAWLSTFFIIIVLIMLNMLLAIIFETYSEVRTSIGGNAETLGSQMYEIYRRWKQRRAGLRVGLPYAQACLLDKFSAKTEPHLERMDKLAEVMDFVTHEELRELVPGMPANQAARLCKKAWKFGEEESSPLELLDEEEEAPEAGPAPDPFSVLGESGLAVANEKPKDSPRSSAGVATLHAIEATLLARQEAMESNFVRRLDRLEELMKAFAMQASAVGQETKVSFRGEANELALNEAVHREVPVGTGPTMHSPRMQGTTVHLRDTVCGMQLCQGDLVHSET